MSISVKVVRVPGAVQDLELEDGATVQDALAAAGTSVGGNENLKLNGASTTTDARLSTGDRLIIAKGAKGNG